MNTIEGSKDRVARKATYFGAGAGLVLFALIGLLPGSLLGGVMGLNIVGALFGFPVTSGVLSRMIVAASMLMGVLVAGIVFVVGCSVVGWLLGTAIDALRSATQKERGKERAGVR